MPSLHIEREILFKQIGKTFTDDEFTDLCFDFGIELDEITVEDKKVTYKIDLPANRYDLLCNEGLGRALKIFITKEKLPSFQVNSGSIQVFVKPEVLSVRPIVVCAVLRDVHFDEESFASFINLQEKLHQNICKKRKLVSIGTHDLDTVEAPFFYEAHPPADIVFAPLNQTQEMNSIQLFTFIEKEMQHLKDYLSIISGFDKYPVIYDNKHRVLSLPPIINSNHSKMSVNTKNVFIDVTAIDATKASVVLTTIVTSFAQYCKQPFTVESVNIISPTQQVSTFPDVTTRQVQVEVDYLCNSIGVTVDVNEICSLLSKMMLESVPVNDGKSISVTVPSNRSDIFHPCDVMEDFGIAYGYNKLVSISSYPTLCTKAKQQPVNKLSDKVRRELAQSGYTELLTLSLCSIAENYNLLNRAKDNLAVKLANPKTIEFQIARTSLLPGLLKTLATNRKIALPLQVFEVSDVVLKSTTHDVGARNERHAIACLCDTNSNFEVIRGLLDHILSKIGANRVDSKKITITASSDDAFIAGMRGDILLDNQKIGVIGVLHPEILINFKVPFPCTLFEFNLEPLI
eukprot:TRINITY_DN2039_c2_g1_i1.p1 TRINITY_DN2039_c2_g1~~TRINITY_DN2039_c2_g1_i1.p1  ORF type:complete len:572 (-),score=233.52 TRINITY_DN2039_c2_g1_i1:125-1840(-)